MSIRWWLKALFLAALLVATAYFFGMICKQVGMAYQLLLFPSRKLLTLLLRLLLALGLMAVTGGIVAALLRPLWVASIAFALSGLALLLGWEVTRQSAALALLYVLAAIAYAAITQGELAERIHFSVRAVTQNQLVLLVALLLVAAGSFYFGCATYISEEGLAIPEKYRDQVSERAANACLLYTSPSPRDRTRSRMPSSA